MKVLRHNLEPSASEIYPIFSLIFDPFWAIGRSKGDVATKILDLTDVLGNLIRSVLMPGHRFDNGGLPPLIYGLSRWTDRRQRHYSNSIIADSNEREAKIIISQHHRRASLPLDKELYRRRRVIENFLCRLKQSERIDLPANKPDEVFGDIVNLADAIVHQHLISTTLW